MITEVSKRPFARHCKAGLLLLGLVLSLSVMAQAEQVGDGAPTSTLRARGVARPVKVTRINQTFVNADLVYVLKVVAKAMNRNIYVGPTVAGSVSWSFGDTDPEVALRQILKPYPNIKYKLIEGPVFPTVVVASQERLQEIADGV